MRSMTKRVNVKAPVAIRNITPPIYGTCKDIIMTTGDILKCICKRAIVEEILPDGSTVRLNMSNYYTDNGAGLVAKKPEVKKPQIQNPVHIKVPVAPKEQVVETKTEEPKEAEAVEVATPVQDEVTENVETPAEKVVLEADVASETAQSVSDAVTEVDNTSAAAEDAVVTESEEKVEVAEEKAEQAVAKTSNNSKKKSSNKKK